MKDERKEADRMSSVEEHLVWAGAQRGTVRVRSLAFELARRNLACPELARRAGLTRATVVSAATGTRRTQIRMAREIARVLGVNLVDLCAPPEPHRPATTGREEGRGAA